KALPMFGYEFEVMNDGRVFGIKDPRYIAPTLGTKPLALYFPNFEDANLGTVRLVILDKSGTAVFKEHHLEGNYYYNYVSWYESELYSYNPTTQSSVKVADSKSFKGNLLSYKFQVKGNSLYYVSLVA